MRLVRSGASGSAIGATGTPKGRVAVRRTLPLGIKCTVLARPRGEWQYDWRGQACSGTSGSAIYTATRYRAYRTGTLRDEWQCDRRDRYAQGPSGSVIYTATRR